MNKIITLMMLTFVLSLKAMVAVSVEILNGENTPGYILDALTAISLNAGEDSISIASKSRTVTEQIEVMLDYYILCNKGKFVNQKAECGISLAKQVYHRDCHAGLDLFDANVNKAENIRKMSEALTQSIVALGESRTCMNHVVVPGIATAYIAVDIKPSSINNRKKFYHAVKNHPAVIRFYYPDIRGIAPSPVKDSAFHLEFVRKAENDK